MNEEVFDDLLSTEDETFKDVARGRRDERH